MASFSEYSLQYTVGNTVGVKRSRTISDVDKTKINAAVDDNGQAAATVIDNFMRAFINMSTNSYDTVNIIGKVDIIDLINS